MYILVFFPFTQKLTYHTQWSAPCFSFNNIFWRSPHKNRERETPHCFSQLHSILCLDGPQVSQPVPYWLIFILFLVFGKEQENHSCVYLLWCFRIFRTLASPFVSEFWFWELAQLLEPSKGLHLFIGEITISLLFHPSLISFHHWDWAVLFLPAHLSSPKGTVPY